MGSKQSDKTMKGRKVKDSGQLFDDLFPHLDLSDYLNRHKNRDVEATVDYILKSSNLFKEKVENIEEMYLKNMAEALEFDEINENEAGECFECAVCFGEFPKARGFECTHIRVSENTNLMRICQWICKAILLLRVCAQWLCKSAFRFFTSKSEKDKIPNKSHTFCLECIRSYALQSTTEGQISPIAYGIRCMVSGCENTILFASIESYLSPQTRFKLSTRLDSEVIANLGNQIKNLEHCKCCHFAMVMDVSSRVDKVFRCHRCNYAYCRICGVEWDQKHFGRNCRELFPAELSDVKKKREYEKALNEVVVRVCPNCKLQFVKLEGCNMMTCRCRQTMCYICRETSIDLRHFKDSNGGCPMYSDDEKIDEEKMKEVHTKYEAQEKKSDAKCRVI